ncbi:transcription elongation factor s 2 [Grosmannia clavigera kw1407]|uniref:Transcription elongation factor n=1 Tax=Grosmannia clavigera (strain kw1407 / UAMH 11150) TaxID=655863 RepID=F0XN24_GROCL|nr:transcription elongation factor s 2 [Grosmannia clavigera kw1407]EFX00779.1 transcription elongation factor s 2 [Grosmannia clavigera kw1407]
MADRSVERELTSRVKALNKAIASNEPAHSILAIMETLKKAVAPTEDVLRSTRAGHTVGKLRAHANHEVKSMATEIVTKWKKAVELEKKRSGGAAASKRASPANHSSSTGTPQRRGTTSPGPAGPDARAEAKSTAAAPAVAASSGTATASFQGDPDKRKFETDGVDVNRTGVQSRDNCIGLLYNGLAFRSTELPERVLAKAIEVEKAAFVVYKGETAEYRAKLRSLFQNLKNRSNPALGRRVVAGEIAADAFVVMSSDELKSAHLKQLESDLQKENMKKAQVPMTEKSISDALTCGKCKQRKVSYTQAQTRSADEPMTTFCECTVCGHRWKFS